MNYPVPTEHERRALFAWLKQASSLTAWRRQHSYQQAFLDAVQSVYEQEQRTPALRPTIPTDWFADVLASHDAFTAALDRLQRGERRCFDFLGARGHFSQGIYAVTWWQERYEGAMFGRNGFGPDDSPRWPEISTAMTNCLEALSDISMVLQKRHTDVPAPIEEMGDYVSLPANSLVKWWLARPNLAPVPVVEPELLVPARGTIPHYGIWEPVQVTRAPGILGVFRAPPPVPSQGRPLDGCMNYLHAGSAAPTIAFPGDGPRKEGRATTWRLVWPDHRYGPNIIPPEENDYVFVRP